jgi:two-component system, response regulator PdtaR
MVMADHQRRLSILIIEDEKLLVFSLRLLIEEGGRHTVAGDAADLPGALAAVEQERPDLALVDIQLMRGESGIDIARELRTRDIPVMLMSGNPPHAPLPGLAIGCLAKPFSDTGLLEAIEIAGRLIAGGKAPDHIPPELHLYI